MIEFMCESLRPYTYLEFGMVLSSATHAFNSTNLSTHHHPVTHFDFHIVYLVIIQNTKSNPMLRFVQFSMCKISDSRIMNIDIRKTKPNRYFANIDKTNG